MTCFSAAFLAQKGIEVGSFPLATRPIFQAFMKYWNAWMVQTQSVIGIKS